MKSPWSAITFAHISDQRPSQISPTARQEAVPLAPLPLAWPLTPLVCPLVSFAPGHILYVERGCYCEEYIRRGAIPGDGQGNANEKDEKKTTRQSPGWYLSQQKFVKRRAE